MLRDKSVRNIADKAGLSGKAVRRLLGSLKVAVYPPVMELKEYFGGIIKPKSENFDVGLRVNLKEHFRGVGSVQFEILAASMISEYRRSCPRVMGWISRGDFDVDKVPADLNRAKILHASRTAGRVRAKAMRQQSW